MVQLPDRVPLMTIAALLDWFGPVDGVMVVPLVDNVIVVADEKDRFKTPPNRPSNCVIFVLTAVVPHAPDKSPVLGMFREIFDVTGI